MVPGVGELLSGRQIEDFSKKTTVHTQYFGASSTVVTRLDHECEGLTPDVGITLYPCATVTWRAQFNGSETQNSGTRRLGEQQKGLMSDSRLNLRAGEFRKL
jgi:hypothetical protein